MQLFKISGLLKSTYTIKLDKEKIFHKPFRFLFNLAKDVHHYILMCVNWMVWGLPEYKQIIFKIPHIDGTLLNVILVKVTRTSVKKSLK